MPTTTSSRPRPTKPRALPTGAISIGRRGEGVLPKTLPADESAPGKKDGSDAPLKAPPKKKINFDDSDDEKTKINKQTYEVLKPEMDKLKELMSYQRDCRNFVVSIIHDLSDLDKTTVRER